MIPTLTREWGSVIAGLVDVVRAEGTEESASLERVAREHHADVAQRARAAEGTIAAVCCERLGLSVSEELAMWTLVVSQDIPAVGAQLEAMSGGDLTCGVLASLCFRDNASAAIHALAPSGTLARMGLVEVNEDRGGQRSSWSRRTVRATDRLLAIGLGASIREVDPALARLQVHRRVPPVELLEFAPETANAAVDALEARTSLVLVGGPGTGRRCLLQASLRAVGRECVAIDARLLATDGDSLDGEMQAIVRECCLLDRTPILANIDVLTAEQVQRMAPRLRDLVHPVLATSRPHVGVPQLTRVATVVEMRPISAKQRARLWAKALEHDTTEHSLFLADAFPIAPALVAAAAEVARSRASGSPSGDDIIAGVRSVMDRSLDRFARRLNITQTWADVVLDADQTEAIKELVSRIEMRRQVYEDWGFAAKLGKGLGISALMSGPPGTGKTMVASLIAKDLGLEVYQVDQSKIVSKWIGETEKNLGELFDAAESAHAVLLFDEADGLFAKRTEVRSSNDRNANFETNYLLQRLESFTGVCFLTSNHEANMDSAFRRRLSAHLRFEVPQVNERQLLWKAMIPAHAPLAPDVRFETLARRYVMSGGYIRNAALRAAFAAANDGAAISTTYLERAARLEYEAMGKIAS